MVIAIGCKMLIGKKAVSMLVPSAILSLTVCPQSASASELPARDVAVVSVALVLPNAQKSAPQTVIIPANDSWQFAGCVSSSHECEHQAHNDGYHHHRVVQDHHACDDEPHLACYVQ